MAKKIVESGFPVETADLIKKVCKLVLENGTIEELDAYLNDIKVPRSNCLNCATSTGTIECAEYTICTHCLKTKKNELF